LVCKTPTKQADDHPLLYGNQWELIDPSTYDLIGWFTDSEEAQQSLAIAEQLGDKFLTAKAQNLTGLALSSQRTFRDLHCQSGEM